MELQQKCDFVAARAWPLTQKQNTKSNRYLIHARGRHLLLPYMPDPLHQKWSNLNIDLNKPDVPLTNAVFTKLMHPFFQKHRQRTLLEHHLQGGRKKFGKRAQMSPCNPTNDASSRKQNLTPSNIDITVPYEKLEKAKRTVRQAFQLILNLFLILLQKHLKRNSKSESELRHTCQVR